MGEVWRARDTRLKRDVAVKVLPEAVVGDAKALARFESEAKSLAALSDPNILAIFDVGEESGVRYAVTEFLQGETLRAALGDGPLPVRRSLEIAGQMANGLAAAHENGIVHRDVKPENVFLTKEGQVKILDFGLARHDVSQRDASDTRSPTITALSEKGAVTGTFAYMSPEQARGESVDFRSDQFSFGAVLYEMLSGRRPFQGASAAETMAAIIRDEPEPLATLDPKLPTQVDWLVQRCLSKDPEERYSSTRDLAKELKGLRLHLSEAVSAAERRSRETPRLHRRGPVWVVAAGSALAAVAVCAVLLARAGQRPRPATGRFEIRLPEGYFLEPHHNALALSPDGKLLVFSAFTFNRPYGQQTNVPWGDLQLFLRLLDSLDSRPIPGTEGGYQPIFSPDGNHIAFVVGSPREKQAFLRRVPVGSGAVQTVCACDARFGAAWAPDGSILFASETGPLQKVPATGGTPEPATTLDAAAGEVSHRLPHLLPDGRTVLYTSLRWVTAGMTWAKARIYAGVPGAKERALLVEGGSDGRWAPPGALLFARKGKLFAVPLDSNSRTLTGTEVTILDGVRHAIWTRGGAAESGAAHVALVAEGLLAWSPGSVTPPRSNTLVWVDTSGKESPLEGDSKGPIFSGRISQDGQQVLVSYNYPGMQAEAVDLTRRASRRVTFDANPHEAIWGPGPDRITFESDHEGPFGLYTRRPDAGPEETAALWKPPDGSYLAPGSWSRDGKVLAFVRHMPATGPDIWLLEIGKEPRPFLSTRFSETHPDISPDGRWLLYVSDESGRGEVFARALSGEGGALQVSAGEGREPLWSRDGTSVYYWKPLEGKPDQTLFRVRVMKVSGSLAFGVPEQLAARKDTLSTPAHSWDVAPNGRFLIRKGLEEAGLRAFWDKLLSNRIVVDTGGDARLVSDAEAGR